MAAAGSNAGTGAAAYSMGQGVGAAGLAGTAALASLALHLLGF